MKSENVPNRLILKRGLNIVLELKKVKTKGKIQCYYKMKFISKPIILAVLHNEYGDKYVLLQISKMEMQIINK
jgi:glutaminase